LIDTIIQIPPFNFRIRSPITAVARHISHFYSSYGKGRPDTFVDFDVQVLPGKGLRRWWRPQARFLLDEVESFFPLPMEQAAPMLEWGLNWCLASRPLGYLVMHAGTLARSGNALMMPGAPGAGKSTLCAALCLLEEWQLFSDELAILDPTSGLLHPHPRPISLKNDSIRLVAEFPNARLGAVYTDTHKGTISHARCPDLSIAKATVNAHVRWIVFPRFASGQTANVQEISRAEAFTWISEQSFNKERMGETGFQALCSMLTGARCFQIQYGSTQEGLQLIRDITSA
jgi:HprK-related kinase A